MNNKNNNNNNNQRRQERGEGSPTTDRLIYVEVVPEFTGKNCSGKWIVPNLLILKTRNSELCKGMQAR
jgi:hypothetical protein